MKVCDLTQAYTSKSGGVRTYIQEKQRYIMQHTEHQHVLVVPGEKDCVWRDRNMSSYQIAAAQIPHCKPYRFTCRLDKVMAILKEEQPDVIELGSAYVLPFAGFLFRRKWPCALVGFYHTDFPSAYVEKNVLDSMGVSAAERAKSWAEGYAHFIYNRCDATVVSSELFKKKLEKMGILRIQKIHLGVDLDVFHPSKRNAGFRKSLGLREEDLLLVYCGRFDHEKRLDMLLKAFECLSADFRGKLLLIGDGPLKLMAVEHAQRSSKIFVLPFQTEKNRMATYLASADIYVTAGPHETFGLSVVEAQACGRPVVGVAAGALKERVLSSVGILGAVDSPEDMARNITYLSMNGFRSMGQNARELVEKEYSWKQTFSTLFEMYENLFIRDAE